MASTKFSSASWDLVGSSTSSRKTGTLTSTTTFDGGLTMTSDWCSSHGSSWSCCGGVLLLSGLCACSLSWIDRLSDTYEHSRVMYDDSCVDEMIRWWCVWIFSPVSPFISFMITFFIVDRFLPLLLLLLPFVLLIFTFFSFFGPIFATNKKKEINKKKEM